MQVDTSIGNAISAGKEMDAKNNVTSKQPLMFATVSNATKSTSNVPDIAATDCLSVNWLLSIDS